MWIVCTEFATCHTLNFELTPRHLKIYIYIFFNLCTLESHNVCVYVCVRALALYIQISFRNSTVSTPFYRLTISFTPNEDPSSAKL